MVTKPPPGRRERPVPESVSVRCAATYAVDPGPGYAFVFQVPVTASRFTIHSRNPDQYLVTDTYQLHLINPDKTSVALPAEDWRLLCQCLHTIEDRWEEAIAEANVGAQSTSSAKESSPGYIDVEPTSTGYRDMAGLWGAERDRVQRLHEHIETAGQVTTQPEQP